MRTPLGRVLGHGSAKSGTGHFWYQRLTGLALLPLSVFAVVLLVFLAGRTQPEIVDILGRPIIGLPLLLLLVLSAWHMKLGMQEVIEDYIHTPMLKLLATLGNIGFSLLVAAASAFALLRLTLSA